MYSGSEDSNKEGPGDGARPQEDPTLDNLSNSDVWNATEANSRLPQAEGQAHRSSLGSVHSYPADKNPFGRCASQDSNVGCFEEESEQKYDVRASAITVTRRGLEYVSADEARRRASGEVDPSFTSGLTLRGPPHESPKETDHQSPLVVRDAFDIRLEKKQESTPGHQERPNSSAGPAGDTQFPSDSHGNETPSTSQRFQMSRESDAAADGESSSDGMTGRLAHVGGPMSDRMGGFSDDDDTISESTQESSSDAETGRLAYVGEQLSHSESGYSGYQSAPADSSVDTGKVALRGPPRTDNSDTPYSENDVSSDPANSPDNSSYATASDNLTGKLALAGTQLSDRMGDFSDQSESDLEGDSDGRARHLKNTGRRAVGTMGKKQKAGTNRAALPPLRQTEQSGPFLTPRHAAEQGSMRSLRGTAKAGTGILAPPAARTCQQGSYQSLQSRMRHEAYLQNSRGNVSSGVGPVCSASSRTQHAYRPPVQTAVNKRLAMKMDQFTHMRRLKERINNVKPQVDTGPPSMFLHSFLNLKKLQNEEEAHAKMERENRTLVERIAVAMKMSTKEAVDHRRYQEIRNMNVYNRKQHAQIVQKKNALLYDRVSRIKPADESRADLLGYEWKATESYRRKLCKYPNSTTKLPPVESKTKKMTTNKTTSPNKSESPKNPVRMKPRAAGI